MVETAPKRSLEDILTSNSEALLAESVPSEHAGDAQMNEKELPGQNRKLESDIKLNAKPIQEPIKNRTSQMEVEHPQKLHHTPLLSQEVPGPSGSIVQSNRSGNQMASSLPSSRPTRSSVPNVPEHFRLPGPSGSTTAASCVTVEEKVSQHTQGAFKTFIPRRTISMKSGLYSSIISVFKVRQRLQCQSNQYKPQNHLLKL